MTTDSFCFSVIDLCPYHGIRARFFARPEKALGLIPDTATAIQHKARPWQACWLGLALMLGALGGGPAPAIAQGLPHLGRRARALRSQMARRGEPEGEIHLALAALYARGGQQKRVYRHLDAARRQGIAASRVDLVLGGLFRRSGRFDAAFSTLVRVLVQHEEQPYALVELWKTLYQCRLQGAEVKTDTIAVQQRLAASGLYFPRTFELRPDGARRSREITAAGYNNLLAGKARFAAGLFEAAIEHNPSNPQAHRGLGIARARMQDYLRAAGAYLVYLALSPDAPDAGQVDRVLMEYWQTRYSAVR
jgi:tetratricopeptide (TPR) repeat protein